MSVGKLKQTRKGPYKVKPGPRLGESQRKVKSSAQIKRGRIHLTCADWLEVLNFRDDHPNFTQGEIVKYFSTRYNRTLVFTQSSLCRNIARRQELESRAKKTPTALSSKRPHIVANPQVEQALVMWQQSMEARNELVNGAMLIEKRARFENAFNVPQEERLTILEFYSSPCRLYLTTRLQWHLILHRVNRIGRLDFDGILFFTVSIVSDDSTSMASYSHRVNRIGRLDFRWHLILHRVNRIGRLDFDGILFFTVSIVLDDSTSMASYSSP
ncbi:uncharacterized protein FOMMEDRAFT_152955, partial [Fomitiporia mediterranea MF3/22]|uniref:uncharacterized protein n=1 Tax=Fomitiporia mediterranea (strain MF3/22) TaxID=694068 RepID=UPI00044084B4